MYVRRKENAGESYKDAREILLVPEAGVRYTVPSVIRIEHMAKELTVRFRVGGVYKNCYISCYLGKERIIHRKRPVVAPGEMCIRDSTRSDGSELVISVDRRNSNKY